MIKNVQRQLLTCDNLTELMGVIPMTIQKVSHANHNQTKDGD